MPEPMPGPPSLEPRDSLTERLDALGRALAAEEPPMPPVAMLAAVTARRHRRFLRRVGVVGAAAAIVMACCAVYLAMNPGHSATNTGPIAKNTASPLPPTPQEATRAASRQTPTLATLRKLNQEGTPETLRLPTVASGDAESAPTRPTDAHYPAVLAHIVGSAH